MPAQKDHTYYVSLFEENYKKYLHRVQFYIYNYVSDWDIAKSIAHDVFSVIWNGREKIDFEREMLPYLFVVAKNRALNHLKKIKVERGYANSINNTLSESDLNYHTLENDSSAHLYSKEVESIYKESISKMPEKIRRTFVLSRLNNLKYEEISAQEGVSIKTVEYRISVALRMLRVSLADYLPIILGYYITELCFI